MGDQDERDTPSAHASDAVRENNEELHASQEKSCFLAEPHPLLFGFLLIVPYIYLTYHALHGDVNMYSLIPTILVNGVCLAATVMFLLLCVKMYYSRDCLVEWTEQAVHHYTGHVLHVLPDVCQSSVAIQTDNADFQRQGDRLQNSHTIEMRTIRRHIRQMRSKFSQRVRTLKNMSKERNEILTKLQLKFPEVQHERETLIAEREAIEKQLEEEKRRNRELIGRFQRISQQFSRIGHAQYPPPLMSLDFHGISKVQ